MATKNIAVREETYRRPKALKREDESFSDLVDRPTAWEHSTTEVAGTTAGLASDASAGRERLREEFAKEQDELRGR
ncbi:hypothetical protein BRD13_07585 [Halobacteriales archaeon SW_5_70_135]|nr:MAG: hypothetical protein BRD13_07585 [Halobacteriales archaeon SW_5_70_135]